MRNLTPYIATVLLLVACSSATSDNTQQSESAMGSYNAAAPLDYTLPEMAKALDKGEITSVFLAQDYLSRIDAVDRRGPRLHAIIAINPDALALAKASDERRSRGESLGLLDGVPILLKDNIETLDPMATTAGSFALADNFTGRDSPLVAGLRAQGAVILGKTNLSQWANFRSNDSISGWSAIGGQVRNPHMLDRSPCGSSSGSGSAVAASLGAASVGTETNGSIICPSNVNGIVGFKPTVGVVSQQYIVPISASQDTAGPMTRSVEGAAMMMNAMATDGKGVDFTAGLSNDALQGKRIGVLRFAQGSHPRIQSNFDAAISDMEKAGAIIVEIDEFENGIENFWGKSLTVLEYEFKDGLDAYLSDTPESVQTRSLADVIVFNAANDMELSLFDQSLFDSSQAKGAITDEEYITARDDVQRGTRELGIDKLMAEYEVDVLVSPSGPVASRIDPLNGDVWPAWAGAGWMAAIAGYPHITVPMGTVDGMPVGVSFMAGAGQDSDVLAYGYAYEQISQKRVEPQYLENAEEGERIGAAVYRTPLKQGK